METADPPEVGESESREVEEAPLAAPATLAQAAAPSAAPAKIPKLHSPLHDQAPVPYREAPPPARARKSVRPMTRLHLPE